MAIGRENLKRLRWWQVLLLSFFFLCLAFSAVATSDSRRPLHSAHPVRTAPWKRTLDELVTPSTMSALEEDETLQKHYRTFVGVTAEAIDWLAVKYPSTRLDELRDMTNAYARNITAAPVSQEDGPTKQNRALTNPFAALLGGGASASSSAAGATGTQSSGLLSGLGDLVTKGLSGVGSGLLGDLAGAGMFLGIGIGQGAASGLNLTSATNAKAVAQRVAAASGMNSTGLNPAIQNLGSGLAGTLAGSVNVGSLASAGGSIGPAVLSLATGIGNGTVTGLKINNITMPMMMMTTTTTGTNSTNVSLPDILGTFGFGLSSTIASNINVSMLGNAAMTGQIMQQIPSVALGLAQGLGSGAVSGFKINQAAAPPTGTNISDIAGSFGFGLSQSVSSNVDIKSITSNFNLNQTMLGQVLGPAASGFGKGLGEGIPIGLGLQPDPGQMPMQATTNGSIDFSSVAENFALGLTSRALANGTISKLMSMQNSSGGGVLGNVDVGKAAGGFARGLIQGAGDSINAIGGVQALIDGNSTMPTAPVTNTLVQFNDSVSGAAVGFGQGFGTQGVLVAKSIIGQAMIVRRRRDIENAQDAPNTDLVSLTARQTGAVVTNSNGITTFNLSSLVDTETISTVLQKGIDVLSCEGVGGLATVALALVQNGALPMDSQTTQALRQFKDILPNGTIHFVNEGNSYMIDTQQVINGLDSGLIAAANGITINGQKLPMFAGFLAVHSLLGLLVIFTLLPLVLGLESARNILVQLRKSHVLSWVPKWMNITWFFVIAPSFVLVVVFGVLVAGNSAHFRTVHGVLGLLTVISGALAVGLQYAVKLSRSAPGQAPTLLHKIRTNNNGVLVALVAFVTTTGFADLSKITVCLTQIIPFEIAISAGLGLGTVYVIGSTITQLELYLAFRDRRMKKKKEQLKQESTIDGTKGEKARINIKEIVVLRD